MNKNIDINDEEEALKRDYPLLYSIGKENRFEVPDGYFDSLPSIVIEKCVNTVDSGKWMVDGDKWYVWENLKSYILNLKYLAAAASLGVICFFIFRSNEKPVSYEAMLQNIPDSAIVASLDNNIADINMGTLEDLQTGDNETATTAKSDTASGNDEEIISYLLDHNINESDISQSDPLGENQPSSHDN